MSSVARTKTQQGTVKGTHADGVVVFRAIPYAASPVGDRRFEAPAAPAQHDELDCMARGALAPQLPSRLEDVMGPLRDAQSEDCLHLTVWTPAIDSKKRPVVVWLHGGAWQSGGGDIDWYSGANLAAQGDIVVVAPNYRLGALGWLYIPGATANVGLLDQEAAVEWVYDNIENFGGDPEAITLMGQSAGGSCIAALLGRQPRFKRAILQSASLGRGFREASEAAALSELVLEAAGANNIDEARTLPYQAFLQAQGAPSVLKALQSQEIGRPLFCPVVDGSIIANDITTLSATATSKADVLVGSTLNEMAAFPNVQIDDASQRAGEEVFGAPARLWAQDTISHGKSAWAYRYDYAPTSRFGACHCIELPFLFGTFQAFGAAPMLAGMSATHAEMISHTMQKNWISFIRNGTVQWPPYPHIEIIA